MNTVSDLAAVAMASVSKATQGSLQKNNSFTYIVATRGSQAVATRGCFGHYSATRGNSLQYATRDNSLCHAVAMLILTHGFNSCHGNFCVAPRKKFRVCVQL